MAAARATVNDFVDTAQGVDEAQGVRGVEENLGTSQAATAEAAATTGTATTNTGTAELPPPPASF